MNNTEYILSLVKNKIHIVDPKAKIYLFGSRARDEHREDSDWDFLILTEKKITQHLKNKISDLLFEAELETDQILTSIVQNNSTWNSYSNTPIYKNINIDSIEL